MKTLVVTDERGTLAGLVRYEDAKADKDAPEEAELVPLEGQKVHEVELPEELERMESALEMFETLEREYDVDPESSRLIRKDRKGQSST
jgi:hypothetical protein